VNNELDISRVLTSFSRQKGIIIAVFVVVSALSAYLSVILPEVYRSSTLILVSPQKVPTSFVFSTVTTDLNERMQSITQEILSRTRLEKIVEEFGLYGDSKKISTMEDRVETLRRKINIEFRRNNIFQLSFESENPEKAKQVASRLASVFIEQNLQVREQQAIGTKSFINAEAENASKPIQSFKSLRIAGRTGRKSQDAGTVKVRVAIEPRTTCLVAREAGSFRKAARGERNCGP
jgi:uncharacterized protein involved in exopolysaccharide biosynthesis